jgi:hypothetical protein
MRLLLLLGIVGGLAFGQTQMVLYSSGLALVDQVQVFSVAERGILELSGFPADTLWETLSVEGVEVLGLQPLSPKKWELSELLGKEVTIQTAAGAFRGILRELSPEGLVLETEEGAVVIRDYVWLRGPAYQPLPKTQALLHYRAEEPGEKALRFRYLTFGLAWKISYDADFQGNRLKILGKALIQNDTGVDFPKTSVTLVAGEIRKPGETVSLRAIAATPEAIPTETFEYYRYDLPGTWDLPRGEMIVPVVQTEVPAAKFYRFSGGPVEVRVRFNTGETILPSGEVRVYSSGVFVGADSIPHLSKGKDAELFLGAAFDLEGTRTQIKREQIGENLFRETWRITLSSSKDEAVEVEVIETLSGYWRILSSSLPYEILDAQRVKFAVPVAAGSETSLEYTVEWHY